MDNVLIMSIVGLIITITIGIGWVLNKKYGNSKVNDTIDIISNITNSLSSLLETLNIADKETVVKIKFIIIDVMTMLKDNGDITDKELISQGIRLIKKNCYDNNIKLTDEQYEIVKNIMIIALEMINRK